MAGKYAEVIKKLPKEWGTDPGYQQKVNAIKLEITQAPKVEEPPLSDDALEDLLLDVAAMLSVINDKMITNLGGQMHASKLAAAYRRVRMIKDTMEEQEKTTNVLLEAYKQLLVDQYENEDCSSLKLTDGGSVGVRQEPHGKVVDREANRKWAMESGLENLLALPWQTVNALTKEALLKGEEPPPGVEATARAKVVVRK